MADGRGNFSGSGSRNVLVQRILAEVDRRITSSTVTIGLGPALSALPTYAPFTATDSVAVLTSGGLARRALGSTLRNYILSISGGTATIAENLTTNGNLSVLGNTALGDATTDTLTLTAQVASDIIPNAATFDLGSVALPFAEVHGTAGFFGDATIADDLTVTDDSTLSGDVRFGGPWQHPQEVTGTFLVSAGYNGALLGDVDIAGDIDIAGTLAILP